MIEEAFAVATEFRFDIGQAMLNTAGLKGAVDDLAKAASDANNALSYFASGLVAHLGFGSGGLLAILTRAVELSEEFNTGALGFVNSISSNMRVLSGTIGNFNDQLGTSRMLMDHIGTAADEMGISRPMLAQLTQTYVNPLAQHGKAGQNFGNAIDLAKHSIMAGEATGMHPMAIQDQILRALNPGQGFGGKLFERLLNTEAFRNAHVIHANQGANMNVDRKMDLVIRAMTELGENADFLRARADNLRVSFNILKAQVEAVIKPIGDAIGAPIVKIFHSMSNFLKAHGAEIGQNIGAFIADIFEDPRKLFINLYQLKNLGHDWSKALKVGELYGTFRFVQWVLNFLGIQLGGGLLRRAFGYILDGVLWLVRAVPWGPILRGALRLIGTALLEFAPIVAAALFVFQAISRARGMAIANDAVAIPKLIPGMTHAMLELKAAFSNIMLPVSMLLDLFAQWLAPLFETSNYMRIAVFGLQMLADVLKPIGQAVVHIMAFGAGLGAVASAFEDMVVIPWLLEKWHQAMALLKPYLDPVIEFFKRIASYASMIGGAIKAKAMPYVETVEKSSLWQGIFGKGSLFGFGRFQGAFDKGQKDFLDKHEARAGLPGQTTSKYVVNNNQKYDVRFDMREQMEPDRIAFAVIEQIKHLAKNPTQGARGSLHSAFGNPQFAGAR